MSIAKSITSAGTIETAIKRAKEALEKRAKKKGLDENFGAAEAEYIHTKFIPLCDYSNATLKKRTLISNFKEWASNYSLEDIK
jgi:hypothetical protein